MSQQDMWFLIVTLILASTLVVFIVQFIRSRRRGDSGERGGNWWEGPWDEDRKP